MIAVPFCSRCNGDGKHDDYCIGDRWIESPVNEPDRMFHCRPITRETLTMIEDLSGSKRKPLVLHPRLVSSKHDGQWHKITVSQLLDLYGVRVGYDYWQVDDGEHITEDRWPIDAVHLYPRHDGAYIQRFWELDE